MADKKASQFAIAADLDDAVLAGYVTGDATNNWQFTISLFDSRYYQQGSGFSASAITSGMFDDARISQSSVVQHVSSISHSNLSPSSLGNDDHTIYHTDARGDARYYTQTQVDDLLSGVGGGESVVSIFGRTGVVTAQAGDYDADKITETTLGKIMTASERSKLGLIEDEATADQSDAEIETAYNNRTAQVSAGERTAGTETAVRRFSPEDIAIMAGVHGAVDSVFGRTGVVVATTGDYDAEDITETATAKIMTAAERTKLDGIEAGAKDDQTASEIAVLFDAAYNSSFWRDTGGVNILEDGTVAGNGSTDDGAAINAILAAAGVGATIYFPSASGYKTSVPLVPMAQQTLVGLGGFGATELIADGVIGAIIQPNANFAAAGKTGVGIVNFKFSGTCDYGIRMINCTRFRMQDLWFNFGNAVANVSDLTNDCINLGDSWGGIIQRVYAYVETATTTPARSVIWAEGAINGTTISRLETAAGSQYGIWLGDEDLTGDDDPALPTGCSFEGLTLQRHEIALYAKRCRGVVINGFYSEGCQVGIRAGSDDSTTDRCANLIVNGGHITALDGTIYGWADNSTGAIELIRAYGCAFNSINFSEYGSGASEQMLYVKRAYGCAINNPTRFNFAMSDMRPAISFDGSVDANSRVTVTGNGTYGDQTLWSSGSSVFAVDGGTEAPLTGTKGDVRFDRSPDSGAQLGWLCTATDTWESIGVVTPVDPSSGNYQIKDYETQTRLRAGVSDPVLPLGDADNDGQWYVIENYSGAAKTPTTLSSQTFEASALIPIGERRAFSWDNVADVWRVM